MRVNVYAEELTTETEIVSKTVTDEKFGTRTFYGVRLFLKSAPELHAGPADDDRTAITFWLPWTRANGHDFEMPQDALLQLIERVRDCSEIDTRTDYPKQIDRFVDYYNAKARGATDAEARTVAWPNAVPGYNPFTTMRGE